MPFPIKVQEDDRQYFVTIPAVHKLRASRIAGRRWDTERKVWVYPRTQYTYDALHAEFKGDAAIFAATPPVPEKANTASSSAPNFTLSTLRDLQTKLAKESEKSTPSKNTLPSTTSAPESTPLSETYLRSAAEDLTNIQNTTSALENLLSDLTETIGEIKGDLIVIKDSNHNIEEVVEGLQVKPEVPAEPVQPTSLNPDKRSDLRLIEKALIQIAVITSKNDPSFIAWISRQEPLLDSFRFINETNEHLKIQLACYLGVEQYSKVNFSTLLRQASDSRLLTVNDSIHVPQMLRSLNAHRNCFGHPNMNKAEAINRAITYLHTVALIWSEFAADQVD